MSKKIILFLIIFFFSTKLFSEQKIVYLNMDKIITESIAGKKFINEYVKKKEKNIEIFKNTENKFKKEETDILLKKNILNNDEYNKIVNDFKKRLQEYKIKKSNTINNHEKIKIKGTNNLLIKIGPILEKYSIDNSISIILQKKNILIGQKELDITNLIMKKLNEKIKNIEIK